MEGGRTVEGEEGKAVEMDEEGDEELMAVEKRVRVKIRVKKAMKKKTQRRWEDAVVLWLIDGWRRMSFVLPLLFISEILKILKFSEKEN